MSTGSDKSLPPSSPRSLEKSEIEKLLQSGLGDFSVRELLGALLSCLIHAERGPYLEDAPQDNVTPHFVSADFLKYLATFSQISKLLGIC